MNMDRANRRDHVLADTAAQQFAVEHHIIDQADDHDLGAGIAALGELIELIEHLVALECGFDDDQVRCRALLVVCNGCMCTAHVHTDMRLGEPPVLGRDLDDFGGLRRFAKALDRDARHGPGIARRLYEIIVVVLTVVVERDTALVFAVVILVVLIAGIIIFLLEEFIIGWLASRHDTISRLLNYSLFCVLIFSSPLF